MAPEEPELLACEEVCLEVPGERGPRALLQDVTFSCDAGEVVLVRGPSGAGKSSLVGILAGIRRPTAGQVLVHGQAVSRFVAGHRDLARREIGLLPQRLHLFDELTVAENVLLPLVPRRDARRAGEARAAELLGVLELFDKRAQPVRSLSGGERQRVALARALVGGPRVVLLDEPTANQDDDRCAMVLRLVEEARARGAAVVLAAHDARVEAGLGVDQRLRLEHGRLVEDES